MDENKFPEINSKFSSVPFMHDATKAKLEEKEPLDIDPRLVHNVTTDAREYTGGSVSYYTVLIKNPTNPNLLPYSAECNDIIEALSMNYAEGNAFKALWRRAAAKLGSSKRGYKDGQYDAEKVVFFGARLVAQEKNK